MVVQRYQQALNLGFVKDPAQSEAVERLQQCHHKILKNSPEIPGVYLWGRVGRGKTWLMDLFHASLECSSRRQHYHHFMRDIHQRLFQLTGQADPLSQIAESLANEVRVLCIDEFFVNDIGDAVVLGGLVQRLFEQGVILVVTSNQPPDNLYPDGHNRERLLPAIAAINSRMYVVALDGKQDHRLHPGKIKQRYWISGDRPVLPELFARSQRGGIREGTIVLNNRPVETLMYDDHQICCSYDQLCETTLSADEYMALCDRFSSVYLTRVPVMNATQNLAPIARGTEDAAVQVSAGDRILPALTVRDNGVRRFIALVDECYDRGVPLWIEAEVAMDELYPQGYLSFAFRRTLSRLREMQFERFGSKVV